MAEHVRRLKAQPPGKDWVAVGRNWQCPECGKQFVRRGLWHSCVVVSLDDHFRERPAVRKLFDAFHAAIREAGGPVRLSIAKTRIGFITGITFASAMPRRNHLRAGFILLRKLDSSRLVKIEHFPPWWSHTLEIRDARDIDDELRAWLREAAGIGAR